MAPITERWSAGGAVRSWQWLAREEGEEGVAKEGLAKDGLAQGGLGMEGLGVEGRQSAAACAIRTSQQSGASISAPPFRTG